MSGDYTYRISITGQVFYYFRGHPVAPSEARKHIKLSVSDREKATRWRTLSGYEVAYSYRVSVTGQIFYYCGEKEVKEDDIPEEERPTITREDEERARAWKEKLNEKEFS